MKIFIKKYALLLTYEGKNNSRIFQKYLEVIQSFLKVFQNYWNTFTILKSNDFSMYSEILTGVS